MDATNDKGFVKLGYTRNEEKGIVPNSRIIKNIINFGASYKITDKANCQCVGQLFQSRWQGPLWQRL